MHHFSFLVPPAGGQAPYSIDDLPAEVWDASTGTEAKGGTLTRWWTKFVSFSTATIERTDPRVTTRVEAGAGAVHEQGGERVTASRFLLLAGSWVTGGCAADDKQSRPGDSEVHDSPPDSVAPTETADTSETADTCPPTVPPIDEATPVATAVPGSCGAALGSWAASPSGLVA